MTTTKNGHQVSFDVGFESYGGYRRTASEILELSSLVKISEPVFMKHIGAKNQEGIRLWWKKYPENKYLLVTRGKNGLYGFATIKSERRTFELRTLYPMRTPTRFCRRWRRANGYVHPQPVAERPTHQMKTISIDHWDMARL